MKLDLLQSEPMCEWSAVDRVARAVDGRMPKWRASDARRLYQNL